jgi:hypothetical protein
VRGASKIASYFIDIRKSLYEGYFYELTYDEKQRPLIERLGNIDLVCKIL